MRKGMALLGGLGLGAGLMYLLDPNTGRRRRALIKDQANHLLHEAETGVQTACRDMANRTRGLSAAARGMVFHDLASDSVIVNRVRARMGHIVSHPHALEVSCEDGCVRLSGPILVSEVDDLIHAIRKIRGVCDVENFMTMFESSDGVAALQGGMPDAAVSPEVFQTSRQPAARLAAILAGGAMAVYGQKKQGFFGRAIQFAGAGLAVRSLADRPAPDIAGIGEEIPGVFVLKTIHVAAPLNRVFDLFMRPYRLPNLTKNIISVREIGYGRTHWRVRGPFGRVVDWDMELTRLDPGTELAWETIPGSMVRHAGIIRFRTARDGGTQIEIDLVYWPPAGLSGHLLARLFGLDPKRVLDADLARIKTFLESRTSPHESAAEHEARATFCK